MLLRRPEAVLNGICPYFTMFPLKFPFNILKSRACPSHRVLDPFCGRGTTNFAARLLGLESLGVDSSPVAAAITASKLVNSTVEAIISEADAILKSNIAAPTPDGEFWRWAYHSDVLQALCRLRNALLAHCSTAARIALRGVILGALHGPTQKSFPSYFSNQCPRTYAPKPAYATRFWKSRRLTPQRIDLLGIIKRRAERYFSALPTASGAVRLADSRRPESLTPERSGQRFDWVITSPPYYGMRTYISDQWLRSWFLGGPDHVDYGRQSQLSHLNPDDFADDLRAVWQNAASTCSSDASLVIRFGGITDRKADPLDLVKTSLKDSGWILRTICEAGSAAAGKRQADAFLRSRSKPILEYDLWARRRPKIISPISHRVEGLATRLA
jgi:DNA methylase